MVAMVSGSSMVREGTLSTMAEPSRSKYATLSPRDFLIESRSACRQVQVGEVMNQQMTELTLQSQSARCCRTRLLRTWLSTATVWKGKASGWSGDSTACVRQAAGVQRGS